MLLPGRTGFQVDSQTYVVNPSYLVPQLLRGLSAEMPQGPWGTIAGNLPAMLSKEVGNGFAMDWVSVPGHDRILACGWHWLGIGWQL